METLGQVLKYGLDKYGWENKTSYQHGEIDTYIGALLRHLVDFQKGEHIDPESGMSHLKHLFFNAYVLVYLESKGKVEDYYKQYEEYLIEKADENEEKT